MSACGAQVSATKVLPLASMPAEVACITVKGRSSISSHESGFISSLMTISLIQVETSTVDAAGNIYRSAIYQGDTSLQPESALKVSRDGAAQTEIPPGGSADQATQNFTVGVNSAGSQDIRETGDTGPFACQPRRCFAESAHACVQTYPAAKDVIVDAK